MKRIVTRFSVGGNRLDRHVLLCTAEPPKKGVQQIFTSPVSTLRPEGRVEGKGCPPLSASTREDYGHALFSVSVAISSKGDSNSPRGIRTEAHFEGCVKALLFPDVHTVSS